MMNIALAPEGNIDLNLYPAVTTWLSRIQAFPGYVDMPGMGRSKQDDDLNKAGYS